MIDNTHIPNLEVHIGKMCMKNPVGVCSGTFAAGIEYSDFFDISRLGAITTKGVSIDPWKGNDAPRLAETASGMLNCIGLQNPGIEYFCSTTLPWLRQQNTNIIISVPGHSLEDYEHVITRLETESGIDAYELNVSCPNVKTGGMSIGVDPILAAKLVENCRKITNKTLIIKLSPNVTDIASIAVAVEDAGADAISLINSVLGMAINIHSRKPKLSNIVGGLSGPAIKPIAIRMVYQVAQKVEIPILGMGGITCADDAIEFLLAGASAVSVGSANFINPNTSIEVIEGIISYCQNNRVSNINDLVGAMEI